MRAVYALLVPGTLLLTWVISHLKYDWGSKSAVIECDFTVCYQCVVRRKIFKKVQSDALDVYFLHTLFVCFTCNSETKRECIAPVKSRKKTVLDCYKNVEKVT